MENKDVRNLIIIVTLAVAIVYLARPKQKDLPKDLSLPTPSTTDDTEFENASIALKAMREAINAGETSEALNELNSQIIQEYDVKIFTEDGKLVARNRDKKIIALEK